MIRPSRFIFCTWEGGGSVGPVVAVARKLVERGHSVRIMSDRCNRLEAEKAGAAFVPWTRAPSRPDRSPATDMFRDWEAASPPEEFKLLVDKLLTGPALAYAEDVIAELRREPADLAVTSEMLLGVLAGCEAVEQPVAVLTCNLSIYPIRGVPPMGPGLPPAQTAEERQLHAQIATESIALFDSGLPALNDARRSLGLPELDSVIDQLETAEALFLGTARSFDFGTSELPANWRYAGPQLGDPGWARPMPVERTGRPMVLVAFSTTFQNHRDLLQRVVHALATLPVDALVTLGDGIAAQEIFAPGNVTLVHSAPHSEVMPLADLVITHGGHGTVMRALTEGKPMLLVPHGRDQHDNAVRVTVRGAGVSLAKDSDIETIRDAISSMLGNPDFASGAERLGRAIREECDRSTLIDDLEALAGGYPAVAPSSAGATIASALH